ncbi:MAG: 4-phosphoerythronate dehydrogenase [Bacteroidales bacterium]|nr:4-phosphoerythronate dehydrogenase [Bacteroidales bacterium]
MKHLGKIVIDSDIPFIQGMLEPYFEVAYKKGNQICREDLKGASALVVRTRTKCNRQLLENTSVELVATATIGTDHIDEEYCKSAGINVASAPGCNSNGVVEYLFSAIDALEKKKGCILHGKTLGIIGAGHVGSKAIAKGKELGYGVLANDPYIDGEDLTDIGNLLDNSDIVSLHIPLWERNRDYANGKFFQRMKPGAVFINASRGEVLDENALLSCADKLGGIVIDVWKNEPLVNLQLLKTADIATPHIAGYSKEGKRNATSMILKSIASHFGIDGLLQEAEEFDSHTVKKEYSPGSYDIIADDRAFRAAPEKFELLRNTYNYR